MVVYCKKWRITILKKGELSPFFHTKNTQAHPSNLSILVQASRPSPTISKFSTSPPLFFPTLLIDREQVASNITLKCYRIAGRNETIVRLQSMYLRIPCSFIREIINIPSDNLKGNKAKLDGLMSEANGATPTLKF